MVLAYSDVDRTKNLITLQLVKTSTNVSAANVTQRQPNVKTARVVSSVLANLVSRQTWTADLLAI